MSPSRSVSPLLPGALDTVRRPISPLPFSATSPGNRASSRFSADTRDVSSGVMKSSRSSPSLAIRYQVRPSALENEAIESGMYWPKTGWSVCRLIAAVLPGPSRSLPSNGNPRKLFRPSGTMPVNRAFAMSSTAIALFSCRVTKAVRPSGEIAMYSGSRSCATVTVSKPVSPAIRRTPAALSASRWLLNVEKDAVRTVADAAPAARSMMLTEPSGLATVAIAAAFAAVACSASLATSTVRPSAEKVSMSGSAPTATLPTIMEGPTGASASRKNTVPGWVLSVAATATATSPFLTATLLTSFEPTVTVPSRVRPRSAPTDNTCRPLDEVTNSRSLAGSKAEISAPARASEDTCANASVWLGASASRLATRTSENERASTPARSWTVAASFVAALSANETRTGCAASSGAASLRTTWLLTTCRLETVAAEPLVTVNCETVGRFPSSSARSKYSVITSPSPSTLALSRRTAFWFSRWALPMPPTVVAASIAWRNSVWLVAKAVRPASRSARNAEASTPPTVDRAATWSIRPVASVAMPAAVSALSPMRSARVENTSRAMSSRCASLAPDDCWIFATRSVTMLATRTAPFCSCRPALWRAASVDWAAATGSKVSRLMPESRLARPIARNTAASALATEPSRATRSVTSVVRGVTTVEPDGALSAPLNSSPVEMSVPPNAMIVPATPPGRV